MTGREPGCYQVHFRATWGGVPIFAVATDDVAAKASRWAAARFGIEAARLHRPVGLNYSGEVRTVMSLDEDGVGTVLRRQTMTGHDVELICNGERVLGIENTRLLWAVCLALGCAVAVAAWAMGVI